MRAYTSVYLSSLTPKDLADMYGYEIIHVTDSQEIRAIEEHFTAELQDEGFWSYLVRSVDGDYTHVFGTYHTTSLTDDSYLYRIELRFTSES